MIKKGKAVLHKIYYYAANMIASTLVQIGVGTVSVCLWVETLFLNKKERKKAMLNFIYGSVSTVTVFAMVNIIDSNVPNDLLYWVDLYMPF